MAASSTPFHLTQVIANQISFSSHQTKDVDLFLIGKTGNGKSATGNSILRKPKSFVAKSSMDSVTTQVHFDWSIFHGRTIKVVDGPGVGDTRMSDEEALKLVQDRLKYAIAANPDGYHAFLLLVRYGGRFTKEDTQTVDSLKHIFGMDFVQRFCIVVITCGDNLKRDEEDEGTTFEQWVAKQGGNFKQLLTECQGRVVLFDNKTKDPTEKNGQVERLLQVVDGLGGHRYTDENFEKAKRLREKQMIEAKEPRIREETLKETAVLIEMLKEIKTLTPEHQIRELTDNMMPRASKLYQNVQDQDKNTGVLKYSLEAARSILDQVKSQLHHCEKVINDRKKAEEDKMRREQEYQAKMRQEKEDHEKQIAKEKELAERRSMEERQEMQLKFEKQQKEEAAIHKEQLQALQKEMETKSESQRQQMQIAFNEQMKKQNEEAENRRQKEQKELEERIQKEAFNNMKMAEEKFKQELEEERKKREEDEKRRDEEREKERQEERKRHEQELEAAMKKTEEAYEKAKASKESDICKTVAGVIKTIAEAAVSIYAAKKMATPNTKMIKDDP